MPTVPEIMDRIWDGDPSERFTVRDLKRVQYNSNLLAGLVGVPPVTFDEVDRASQFDYDQAQVLEDFLVAIGKELGVKVPHEPHWKAGRPISFVDFERWESSLWSIYKAIGGTGDRIPAEKTLHTVWAVLFRDEWRGAGPWYQDVDVTLLTMSSDCLVFVAETATVPERMAEYNGILQAVYKDDDTVRVWALGVKPPTNIPIKFTTREFTMFKRVVLKSSAWQGNGPWTQTVELGAQVANAIIGPDERNDAEQQMQMADAVIGVSAVSGTKVTLRAIGKKPTADVNGTIAWSESVAI